MHALLPDKFHTADHRQALSNAGTEEQHLNCLLAIILLTFYPFLKHCYLAQHSNKWLPKDKEADDMFSGAIFICWGTPCNIALHRPLCDVFVQVPQTPGSPRLHQQLSQHLVLSKENCN